MEARVGEVAGTTLSRAYLHWLSVDLEIHDPGQGHDRGVRRARSQSSTGSGKFCRILTRHRIILDA